MRTLVVLCACMAITYGQTVNLTLLDYGLDDPSADSCAGVGSAGWYIDRAYDSSCFVRQVRCTSGAQYDNAFQTCGVNEVYIADGDFTCYSTSSTAAQEACAVTVLCNQDSIGILVDHTAIWDQTDADLQLGNAACTIPYSSTNSNYEATYSLLDSSWSDCGITRTLSADPTGGDGYHVAYTFTVKRDTFRAAESINGTGFSERVEEAHNGVVVTREKCFMVDAACYYNADGTVTSSFVPSSANTLTQSDSSSLTFALQPTDCTSTYGAALATEPVVYVNEEVCYRAEITSTWHENIRMQIRSCEALNSNGDSYPLGSRTSSAVLETDSTFDWDCYDAGEPLNEYFSFNAFRFQNDTFTGMNDIASYVQTITISCEVVACELDDYSSDDCFTDCRYSATRRQRREANHQSVMSKYTRDIVKARAFVLPKRESPFSPSNFSYNNTFSMFMFGSGCVLAVVVVGLMVALHKMKKEVKYGVLPQSTRSA